MELQRKPGLSGKNITGINMTNEEILKRMADIQMTYTMPYLEKNWDSKDRVIKQYEKLVMDIINNQAKKPAREEIPQEYLESLKHRTGKILDNEEELEKFYNNLLKEE